MIIDCGSCEVRGLACDDCVVTALLGGPPAEFDETETAALGVLADSGLAPRLRLVLPDPAHVPRGTAPPPAASAAG